jgi:hypothetical protein
MKKYDTLLEVLDQIRKEAPSQYASYHPLATNIQGLDQARAKAFIHLYLKVQFGMLDFLEREKQLIDGSNDGGIDAYHIDTRARKIYFIQSKFRTTEENFDRKNIELEEMLKMDVDRITRGEMSDEAGNRYNNKVHSLIRRIQTIEDIARYDFIVVLLANLKDISHSKVKRLVGDFKVEVMDHHKCYTDLVFPVISGTYYNSANLTIEIDLYKKELAQSRIQYAVETESFECEITLLFVPTVEIAKILYKYRNSILKFNPRSYLNLSNNSVNKDIASTVTDKGSNEFALYNNGITMLSDETQFTERTGRPYRGQLHVANPQIINGGQTAYTLSHIYEKALADKNVDEIFKSKEVMLKVITFTDERIDQKKRLKLIEAISKATNQQTSVIEADRRSNDRIQVELQDEIYNEFGYFYERKKGEFFDGLRNKYISPSFVIDREVLLRVAFAISGKPEVARRTSAKILFSKEIFNSVSNTLQDHRRLFFGYMCYRYLEELQTSFNSDPNNRFGVINYGHALRYGKLAVVFVTHAKLKQEFTQLNIENVAGRICDQILGEWLAFEEQAKKQRSNREYFRRAKDPISGEEILEANFDSYYKVQNVKHDLEKYFKISKK